MKKLGLYGYGVYGKRVSESLRLYWEGEYPVTAIFDKNLTGEKDGHWDLCVLSPEALEEEYKKGTFEAIMVCIFSSADHDAVLSQLTALGIPVFVPGRIEDFARPESFLQEKNPAVSVNAENYSFHAYRNMFGTVGDFERSQFFFLFNEDGKVNIENYEYYPETYRHFLMYPFRLKNPLPEKVYLKGDYCLLAKAYSFNYWHFTFESMDCVYLLEKAGFRGKYIYNERSFSKELLKIMGISSDRLIRTKDFEIHKVYVFETLYGINRKKYLPLDHPDKVIPQMSKSLQLKLQRDERSPKKLYIKRIGVRKLLNGEDIALKNGYTVIVPEEYSVREQMELFYNADIVLCPHGANSTNFLYMRKGAVFVEIFSDRWHAKLNDRHCENIGVHYLELVGPSRENASSGQLSDYIVDEDALQQIILRAEKIAASEAETAKH